MTITMAKPRHAAAVVPLALMMSAPVHANWKFTPAVDVKETYTDNVRLSTRDSARAEFVTEVAPGFRLQNNGPRFQFNSTYRLRYFDLPSDMGEQYDDTQSQLQASLKANLVDELLYLDSSASITEQSVSAFGPLASSAGYGGANQSEVRTWRVTPYLRHRFGDAASAELRLNRDSVDTGRAGLGSGDGTSVSLNVSSGPAFRTLGWGFAASRQSIDDEFAPKSVTSIAALNLQYALSAAFSLTGNIGYDKYDYQALGGETAGKSWSGGAVWAPTTRTRIEANAGKRYYGSSYLLALSHRSRNTVWRLNYNDAVTNTRSQFLLPSTLDTAKLLDGLFAATITDPAARLQAVDAYMRATGLPPALTDAINYFSNRYFLQKQLQASAAFKTARTRLLLSLFGTRRDALSSVDADSAILGPSASSLNNNTRQYGASATWNWNITSRSVLGLSLNKSRSESVTTQVQTDTKAARITLTHQFKPKLRGALELRRSAGPTASLRDDYRENAVVASLFMQL